MNGSFLTGGVVDNESGHSSRVRVTLWWVMGVIAALLIVSGVYLWRRRTSMWTLRDRGGHSVCTVQPTWTEVEVSANCGPRSGRGWQPKVVSTASGFFKVQMCSAPGDVYGAKVVLYGCDGTVQTVEGMPARGFIYPSE